MRRTYNLEVGGEMDRFFIGVDLLIITILWYVQ